MVGEVGGVRCECGLWVWVVSGVRCGLWVVGGGGGCGWCAL